MTSNDPSDQEKVRKQKYDRKVDTWAFGCVLAHMGTSAPPYSQLQLKKAKELLGVIRDVSTRRAGEARLALLPRV